MGTMIRLQDPYFLITGYQKHFNFDVWFYAYYKAKENTFLNVIRNIVNIL